MTTVQTRSAVVLLSGGLDSATAAAIARAEGFHPLHALTVDYGQRHRVELDAARHVARQLRLDQHHFLTLDTRFFAGFRGSALTDNVAVPKDREVAEGIPATYVPARNTILLAYALALAESVGAADIFIGVNAVDYSGYPDCRPAFLDAFEKLANLATRAAVEGRRLHLHAPLLHLSKQQIIQRGLELGVDYGLTHSCYDPDSAGRACGHCDSCLIRARAFAALGLPDPAARPLHSSP